MSYLVPLELPKHCNKCPFGKCAYNKPFWAKAKELSVIDNKINDVNTYGYTCNIEFSENGKYTKVLRARIGKDIEKPDWCKLREV